MKYILLTDDDNNTLLVTATDEDEAREVASAAVFSDGGVSAWLLPDLALPASEEILTALRNGDNVAKIHDAHRDHQYVIVQVTPMGYDG